MKFIGPINKQFNGDKQKAISYMGPARVLIQSLLDRIESPPYNGRGYQHGIKHLKDGSIIEVKINKVNSVPIIKTIITCPLFNESIEKEEFEFMVLPYPESGYLNIEDLSTPTDGDLREFPVLYQSERTKRLSDKTEVSVDWINYEPKSFWYDESKYTTEEQTNLRTALNGKIKDTSYTQICTGKFKLYRQAREALQLVYPRIPIEFPTNVMDDTTGLYRDDEFNYWKVNIHAARLIPIVTFTKFDLPEEADLRGLLKQAISKNLDDEELIIETYILSYLEITTEVHTAYILNEQGATWEYPSLREWHDWQINGDPFTGFNIAGPLAHGWKFSWDGRAGVVLIETTAGATGYNNFFLRHADFRSHVLEIEFSRAKDPITNEITFGAVCYTREISDWQYSHRWQYWVWLASETRCHSMTVGTHPNGEVKNQPPLNTPIYGYYTGTTYKNNTFTPLRISLVFDGIDQTTGPCGDSTYSWFYQDGNIIGNWRRRVVGDRGYEKVKMGAFEITSHHTPTSYYQRTTQTPSCTWTGAYANAGSNPPPGVQVNFVYYTTRECGRGEQGTISLGSDIESYVQWSNECRASGEALTFLDEEFKTDSCRVVIPLNNAESVFLLEYDSFRRNSSSTTQYFNNLLVGIRTEQVIVYFNGGGTSVVSGFNTEGHGWPSNPGIVFNPETHYASSKDKVHCIGKIPMVNDPFEFAIDSTDPNQMGTTVSCLLVYRTLIGDSAWHVGFKVVSGIDREMWIGIDNTEDNNDGDLVWGAPSREEWRRIRACLNGYPNELEQDNKTTPIGFA